MDQPISVSTVLSALMTSKYSSLYTTLLVMFVACISGTVVANRAENTYRIRSQKLLSDSTGTERQRIADIISARLVNRPQTGVSFDKLYETKQKRLESVEADIVKTRSAVQASKLRHWVQIGWFVPHSDCTCMG